MIKCYLSRLMGDKKVRVADVARATGLHRGTITLLYEETAVRIELDAMSKLCAYFECRVEDLFEYIPEAVPKTEND
ncbi:helix-turn-helix transcriptional regulator [Deefgea tanakiae]|uniref:Helix-turn-helix transcriptional regulator n=1 Tax=Deefgea tanakiae TaxID=2865840 RepID=A0ABX8Z497_9NEIS|nr:helix-turn-helix transcriptional regulator [Deefgea tanakiae]QZA77388.1 helix-turn-helix transcriptional regulator [Deefgea tanakiae]